MGSAALLLSESVAVPRGLRWYLSKRRSGQEERVLHSDSTLNGPGGFSVALVMVARVLATSPSRRGIQEKVEPQALVYA